MKNIPICWKCGERILKELPTEATKDGIVPSTLVGCKINPAIKSYMDAESKCPLLPQL